MKSWRRALEQYVANWSNGLAALGRDWMPRYVYHFTDVQNAAAIVRSDVLLSRNEARQRGVMAIDNASQQVIDSTSSARTDYVRLYFRPRTPTQWHNEGIRPASAAAPLGAHCPVPVFLLFDLVDVLSRDDAEFSDGNIASPRATIADTEAFFNGIDFGSVYHEGPMPAERKAELTFARQAEALVRHELPLTAGLRRIVSRTPAEQQTLWYLAGNNARGRYFHLTSLTPTDLYFRRWPHVLEVSVLPDSLNFRISGSLPASRGATAELVVERADGASRSSQPLRPFLQFPRPPTSLAGAVVTLRIDGHLAFRHGVSRRQPRIV